MFEIVDGRQAEARVTGILLAHPLVFGSGELKISRRQNSAKQQSCSKSQQIH